MYIQQNPCDASLTAGHGGHYGLSTTIDRDMLLGSKQYWYTRYQELKALLQQKGPATFFWTVSSADNYWPELHSLMPHNRQRLHMA